MIDSLNGCRVGNGITSMSVNEVGAWVRAIIGVPSWNFFAYDAARMKKILGFFNKSSTRKHPLMVDDF